MLRLANSAYEKYGTMSRSLPGADPGYVDHRSRRTLTTATVAAGDDRFLAQPRSYLVCFCSVTSRLFQAPN